jgi:hypothetical protein
VFVTVEVESIVRGLLKLILLETRFKLDELKDIGLFIVIGFVIFMDVEEPKIIPVPNKLPLKSVDEDIKTFL